MKISTKHHYAVLLFILFLLWSAHSVSTEWFSKPPSRTQATTGDKSPTVFTEEGNVNIQYIEQKYGVSEEGYKKVASELAVTEMALGNFFKILEQQSAPPEDLDSTLREIAKNYTELLQRLEIITSDDPLVQKLKLQARQAIERLEFEKAETLLNQAKARDLDVIQQLQENIQQQQEALEKRQLSAAETDAENGQLQLTFHFLLKLTSTKAISTALQ